MFVSAIVSVEESSGEVEGGQSKAGGVRLGTSLPCVEVLGASAVERTIQRLRAFAAVKHISLVTPESTSPLGRKRAAHRGVTVVHQPLDRWPVPDILEKHALPGVDKVLFIRLGSYVEIDFEDLLQFHQESGSPITRVHHADGPLDIWMIDVNPARPGTVNFCWPLVSGVCSGTPYFCSGYVNPLKDAHDLRRLVVDSFLGRNRITPGGRETKPGVWIEDSAHVHHGARVVAPAYIGGAAKVRASALITRFSNIEHDCEVGPGTAVKGSTILPYTGLGRSLCIARALVDGNRLIHLVRNISVEIEDPKLLRRTVQIKPRPVQVPAMGLGRMPAPEMSTGSLNFSEGEL